MATEAQTAFFSYSRDDSEFALRLAEDLKAAGANVWLDQLDIAPGQRWARAVQDALNNCHRLLVILSPSSVSSTNVEDEVAFALEEHKTVIPVLYRECKVPFQLRPFQRVDFTTDYDRGLRTLLKALGVEQQAVPPGAGVVSATLDGYDQMRVAERARLEEERKQAEQARLEQERKEAAEQARLETERKQREEAARLVAQAEEERKQREEAARLVAQAEAERKQREEAARLAAQAEAERKRREEAARLLALAEAERKQREEAARLAAQAEAERNQREEAARQAAQAEAERKQQEEAARPAAQAEAERKQQEEAARPAAQAGEERKQAVAQARQEEERKQAAEQARQAEVEETRLRREERQRLAIDEKARREQEERERNAGQQGPAAAEATTGRSQREAPKEIGTAFPQHTVDLVGSTKRTGWKPSRLGAVIVGLAVIGIAAVLLFILRRSPQQSLKQEQNVSTSPPSSQAIQPIVLPRPPFEYYLAGSPSEDSKVRLTEISEKRNKITDDEEWFVRNDLKLPTLVVPNPYMKEAGNIPPQIPVSQGENLLWEAIKDGNQLLCVYGFSSRRFLTSFDLSSGEPNFAFDFHEFMLPPKYLIADRDLVEESVTWARVEDGVLYVSNSHNTYAKSSYGLNAYISAIDVKTGNLLWRSAPLISNSSNFLLYRNAIITGYGFSAEPHFLYVLNKKDGRVVQTVKLRKMAEYILDKGDTIFVRTYDTDYEFKASAP